MCKWWIKFAQDRVTDGGWYAWFWTRLALDKRGTGAALKTRLRLSDMLHRLGWAVLKLPRAASRRFGGRNPTDFGQSISARRQIRQRACRARWGQAVGLGSATWNKTNLCFSRIFHRTFFHSHRSFLRYLSRSFAGALQTVHECAGHYSCRSRPISSEN